MRQVLVWLLLSVAGFAQGGIHNDVAFGSDGRPAAGATVRTCTSTATGTPCSPTVTVYSDAALSIVKSSVTADANGNFSFYAAPGFYKTQVTASGSTYTYTVGVTAPDTINATFYGVKGDGTTDDGVTINAAFLLTKFISLPYSSSGYKITTTLNIPANGLLDCHGSTLFHSSSTTTLISASGVDDWQLQNCVLQGSNGGTVTGSQTAEILLSILGGHRWRLNNLLIKNSDGYGIKRDVGTDSASGVHGDRGQIVNVVAMKNYTSAQFLAGSSSEYVAISNFDAVSNTNGLIIAAGNITVTNCNITENVTGVWLTSGSNHGHGKIGFCDINHNTGDSIYADTVTNGFSFDNIHVYANSSTTGKIHLKASNSIEIRDSTLDANIQNETPNGSNNFIQNNTMVSNVATLAPSPNDTNLVLSLNTNSSGTGWWAYNNSLDVGNGTISAGTRAPGLSIGDISASRTTTTGAYYFGSDGNKYAARLTDQLQFGGFTSLAPATDGLSSLGTASLHFNGLFLSGVTVATGTSAIGTGACATTVTTALSGALTTDVVIASPNADLPTQWQKGLVATWFPTSGNVNVRVCNPTAGSITPDALIWNVRIIH